MSVSVNDDQSELNLMRIVLAGDLTRQQTAAQAVSEYQRCLTQIESRLHSGEITRLAFDASALIAWDSKILVFISTLIGNAKRANIPVDRSELPAGMQSLLRLSMAVPPPPRGAHNQDTGRGGFLELLGRNSVGLVHSLGEAGQFLGEALLSLWRFVRGKARYQRPDLALFADISGPQALPIVGLINILLGIVMAFTGAVQLRHEGKTGLRHFIGNFEANSGSL